LQEYIFCYVVCQVLLGIIFKKIKIKRSFKQGTLDIKEDFVHSQRGVQEKTSSVFARGF